ncbi:hypothetical protein DRN63_00235 [Nanoarchaeota archaeon]|nr:MAG: hypothetical protein DRN63_00235 [Nanoarchaeota archaeon]
MSAEADAAERLELLEGMLASTVRLPVLESDGRIRYERIRRELYTKYGKELRRLGFTSKGLRSGGEYVAIAPGTKFSPEKFRKYVFSEINRIFSKRRRIYDMRLFTALLLFEARYSREIKKALRLCLKAVTGVSERKSKENGFIPLKVGGDIDGWWKPYRGDALLIFALVWAKNPPIKFHITYIGRVDGSPISEEDVKEYLKSFPSPERLSVDENRMLAEVRPSDMPDGIITKDVSMMLEEFRSRLGKIKKLYTEFESAMDLLEATCKEQGLTLDVEKENYPYKFLLRFKNVINGCVEISFFRRDIFNRNIPEKFSEAEKTISRNMKVIKGLREAFSSKSIPANILEEIIVKLLHNYPCLFTYSDESGKEAGFYSKAMLKCGAKSHYTVRPNGDVEGILFLEDDPDRRRDIVGRLVSEWGQVFLQPGKAEKLGRRLVLEGVPYHEAVASLLPKRWKIAYAIAGWKKLTDDEISSFEQLLLSGEKEFRELLFKKSINYLALSPDERVADVVAKYLEQASRIECLHFINSKMYWNYKARKALETAVKKSLNIPDAKLIKCGDDVKGVLFSILNDKFLLHIIPGNSPYDCSIEISPREGFAKSFSATYEPSGLFKERDVEKINMFLAKTVEFSNRYENYCRKRISNLTPLLKVAAIGAGGLPPLPKIYMEIKESSFTDKFFEALLDEKFEKAFRSAKYRFGRWLGKIFPTRKVVTYG